MWEMLMESRVRGGEMQERISSFDIIIGLCLQFFAEKAVIEVTIL